MFENVHWCPLPCRNLGMLPWHRLYHVPDSFYLHKPLCMQSYGLSRSQLALCHQNFDHMPIVSIGARIGILQCAEQFKYRHWNCTSGPEAFSFGATTRHGKSSSSSREGGSSCFKNNPETLCGHPTSDRYSS